MRKTVFVLLTLVCIVVQAQKPMSLDPIQKQWTTKNIKVSGGANILQLVSATNLADLFRARTAQVLEIEGSI